MKTLQFPSLEEVNQLREEALQDESQVFPKARVKLTDNTYMELTAEDDTGGIIVTLLVEWNMPAYQREKEFEIDTLIYIDFDEIDKASYAKIKADIQAVYQKFVSIL